MKRVLAAVVLSVLTACSGGDGAGSTGEALVVISAPLTSQPWIGEYMEKGAKLAAKQVNAGSRARIRVEVLDNGGSAQRAADNARTAVSRRAVALIVDGVGSEAVAAVTDPARLAVFIVFEGGESLVDPKRWPTLFRLAPSNKYLCRRLADYLADTQRGKAFALLGDDSTYGREGLRTVQQDLLHNEARIVSQKVVAEGASDVSAQVLQARRGGAQVLVVWARASVVASVLRAVRSTGWDVTVWTGPAGEDPLVRQRLADHPEWVDGLGFVSFRITSEVGGAPFAAYRAEYEKEYGPDRIGVGDVVMPPDWSMYSYDTVKLVEAAVEHAGSTDTAAVLDALQKVTITGANGDERGFSDVDREGVSPDDMYFATFRAMRFYPNRDDKLSTNLPEVPQ